MTKAAIEQRAAPEAKQPAAPLPKKHKLSAFLVTERRGSVAAGRHASDAEADSPPDRFRRRAAERDAARPAGRRIVGCARVRGSSEPSSPACKRTPRASRSSHSTRTGGDAAWESAVQHGQIVAFVPLPIDAELISARWRAPTRRQARALALLGGSAAAPAAAPAAGARCRHAAQAPPAVARLGLAAAVIVCIASVVYFSRDSGLRPRAGCAAPRGRLRRAAPRPRPAAGAPADAATEEKVDALIEQAQRAMRDRHFIDPADGSALALYRSALVLDPASGEARQGLASPRGNTARARFIGAR